MTLHTFVVKDVNTTRFEQLYQIYTSSLVPREQKKRHEIEGLIARSDYRFLAIENGFGVVSFAILHLSTTEPIALLEYMATDASRRNEGLGAHTFREVTKFIDQRAMLVESDSDREANAEDLAIRVRRKNFYQRLGCRQIEKLHYILPLPGEGDPPLMDLLIFDPEGRDKIDGMTTRRWLTSIYMEVYGQRNDDPRIAAMIDGHHHFIISR